MTSQPLELRSHSASETERWGFLLGRLLTIGHFVGLTGDLGAGKTQFSRGVASGCEVDVNDVSSPTYSIVHAYVGRLRLTHVDLYRLQTEAQLDSVGYFDVLLEPGAMLVEWCTQVAAAIPSDALIISLLRMQHEDDRMLCAASTGPVSLALLNDWRAALPPTPGVDR
jgi:tRNA threonylcarbamoyladenosine biosynthesis protein TsaE